MKAQGTRTDDNSKIAGTPSESAAMSLLREQVRVSATAAILYHNRKHEQTSKADSDSAGPPPFFLEKEDEEEVKTPTLTSEEAWLEMRRRFGVAHDPATRTSSAASSASVVDAPTQRQARDSKNARRASVA